MHISSQNMHLSICTLGARHCKQYLAHWQSIIGLHIIKCNYPQEDHNTIYRFVPLYTDN